MAKTTGRWDYLPLVPVTSPKKLFNPGFAIGTPETLRAPLSSDRQGYSPASRWGDWMDEDQRMKEAQEIKGSFGTGSSPVWNDPEHRTFPISWAAKPAACSALGHSGHGLGWAHGAAGSAPSSTDSDTRSTESPAGLLEP